MTFSEFANMLYPLIGKEKKTSEFIIDLTDHIMETASTEHDILLEKADKYNPLCKCTPNMLEKLYNGNRALSKKSARIIISHLDKERFQSYLSTLSTDTIIDLLRVSLPEYDAELTTEKITETCTDLFVSILNDCANQKITRKSPKKELNITDSSNLNSEYEAPPQSILERLRWDSFYKK